MVGLQRAGRSRADSNLYADSGTDPFADTPAHFRTTEVDVLYVTDRERHAESDEEGGTGYGR